jgi:hypothetical protein
MTTTSLLSATLDALRRAANLSLPTVRKVGAMSPGEWLGLTGHVIALTIALTSTIGIYNFGVGIAGSSILMKALLVPVAIFAGVMLQIVIVSSIKLIVREWRRNTARALLAGFVVILMWALTIGASYGSYWNLMSRESYEQRATQQTISAAAEPLEIARSRFASATRALGEVSRHSDQMMTVEDGEGRSCGYDAGVGQGSRYRLRESQKADAAQHATSLLALDRSLTASLRSMDSFDNARLADAYRAASDTLGAPEVGMARQWIEEQRAGFSGGFPVGDTVISCADPTMVRLLDVAAASLKALPKTPNSPPQVTQLSDTDGMMLSFARLFRFGKSDDLVHDSDFVPLLFPTVIELIMTALIVLGELGRPRGGFSDLPGFGPDDGPRPLNPWLTTFQNDHAGGSDALDLYDRIVNHLIELEGAPTVCFAVPAEPGPARQFARKLLVLIARHDLTERTQPLTPYRQRLPFADLPTLVTAGWPWESEHVDLHLLPRTLADDVRRMVAQQAEAEVFSAS